MKIITELEYNELYSELKEEYSDDVNEDEIFDYISMLLDTDELYII